MAEEAGLSQAAKVVPPHEHHVHCHQLSYASMRSLAGTSCHPVHHVLAQTYARRPTEPRCPCRDCIDKSYHHHNANTYYLKVDKMVDVRSLYKPSSPQQPMVKRRRLRLSSVPLVDLRSTSLPGTSAECAEVEARLSSITGLTGTKSHVTLPYLPKTGLCSQGMENVKGSSSVRARYLSSSVQEGQSRFPKLDECAHFHYEFVELGDLQLSLQDEPQENSKTLANVDAGRGEQFCVHVSSGSKAWTVRRSCANFCLLDEQLHRCIYDRKFSLLPDLSKELLDSEESLQDTVHGLLSAYLERFSSIAGNLINCGPILNWLELDNRGNHLIVTDDSAINTPAVAAAYVIKRYAAQAADEISFEVGDMISVIDMPPPEESIWWRGKKGFEVGFFPCECVELIGDKVPHSIHIPKTPMKPVFRKHGKLISFFRSFILSRPSRRKLKQRGILKERVFGCDLGEHLLNSGHEIPMVLTCCSEFIEKHGIVDGIYRLSGITSNIQKLRIAFDEDRVPNLNDTAILQDIHCVASLLKMYFRELPNPLLTYQLYDKFVHAVQSSENTRLMIMRDVVQQLPPPHYRTLEFLVKHLATVASHGADTGMTPKNVAIVWAPNLLRSKELEIGSVAALQVVGTQAIVTEYLIRYVDLIFNEKLPLFSSIFTNDGASMKGSRPKSLAISSSSKLLSLEEAQSRACVISLQSKPKYIEVGGGPANLPSQYHTVIDLVDRKRNVKLKKSPSNWKSFFGKGRSHSQSSKDKQKNMPKRVPPSLQSSFLEPEKPFAQLSGISSHRFLRSVKSAESLSSHAMNLSPHTTAKTSLGATEIFDSSGAIVQSGSDAPSRLSMHSHVRSFSHDSYFETTSEISQRGKLLEDQQDGIFHKDKGKSLECLIMDDFEDVALDMNQIRMNYDRDFDVLSTGTSEMVDSSETRGGSSLQSPMDAGHSDHALSLDRLSHRQFDSVEMKSAFLFEETLKQSLDAHSLHKGVLDSGMEEDGSSRPYSTAKSKKNDLLFTKELASMADANLPKNSMKMELGANSQQDFHTTKSQNWTMGNEKSDYARWQQYAGGQNNFSCETGLFNDRTAESNSLLSRVSVEVHVTRDTEEATTPNTHSGDESGILSALSSPPSNVEPNTSMVSSYDASNSSNAEQSTSECQTLGQSSQESSSRFSSVLDTPTSITGGSSQSDSQLLPILHSADYDSVSGYRQMDKDSSAQQISSIVESSSSQSLGVSWLWDMESSKEQESFKDMETSQEYMDTSTSTLDRSLSKGDGTDLLSPFDTFASETSTPSLTTSGEGGVCLMDEKDRSPLFEYKILVEVDLTEDSEEMSKQRKSQLFEMASTGQESAKELTKEMTFPHGQLCDADVNRSEPSCPDFANQFLHKLSVFPERSQPHSLHRDEPKEKVHFAGRLSPMDESRRKFESEIGRDILHERKMKLELEKIQSEQKCERTSVSLEMKISPRALPPLSDIGIRSGTIGSKFASLHKSDSAESSKALVLDDQEVELRHGRNVNEELKRKSEPTGRGENVHISTETKRHSEPTRVGLPLLGMKADKSGVKGSVKELLSKFEISNNSGMFNKPASHPKPAIQSLELCGDSKAIADDLHARSKVAAECETSKGKVHSEAEQSPSLLPEMQVDSHGAKYIAIQSPTLDSAPVLVSAEDMMSRSLPPDHLTFSNSTAKENSLLFASCDKGAKATIVKEATDNSVCSKSLPFLTDTAVNDIARRERINRYKEERRAQLREKIHSESFKMDKDEKSEYLARLKQKTSGSTRPADEQSYSFRRRSRTVESKSGLSGSFHGPHSKFSETKETPTSTIWRREQSDNAVKKATKAEDGDRVSSSRASLGSGDQENLTCSFLRTIPGRRNRNLIENESHNPFPGRGGSLRERNSVSLPMTVGDLTPAKPPEAKDIKKPNSLPTKQRWRTSSERKVSSSSQSPPVQEPCSTTKDESSALFEGTLQRLQPRSSSWRENSSHPRRDSKGEGSEIVSPTCRIKEVAALFEKESAAAKSKLPIKHSSSALARTKYLGPPGADGSAKDSFRKTPAQYTSAV